MTISNRVAGNAGIRTYASFPISDFQYTKQQMLTWAVPFNICCFLDSHAADSPLQKEQETSVECLLAAGSIDQLCCAAGNAFQQLASFSDRHKDWLFGHFGYGLTKETEPTDLGAAAAPSAMTGSATDAAAPLAPGDVTPPFSDKIGFPDLFFFVPETVIELRLDSIHISTVHDPAVLWREISLAVPQAPTLPSITGFAARFGRDEYLETVKRLQQHILRGDCYEVNFCQEFFCSGAVLDPLSVWTLLGQTSPNPFSAFYRLGDRYLICASPERYLARKGDWLVSQPIKGTAPRRPDDPEQDRVNGEGLYGSAKNRSENVMIVDLVRNDLSRFCLAGSVSVTELFGIYAFPHVFQMISTITGQMPAEMSWTKAIEATFPMGSMTGAPKNSVVSLIERYERSARGIFSGAVGYVRPSGDFDFNVVIRSLMYNRGNGYLSYQVGSGITFYSDPVEEYEECMLKAEGIREALMIERK